MTEQMNWRHTGRFCLASFFMDFAGGMYMVPLPYLAIALGADSMDLGLLMSLRSGVYAVGCLVFPRLCARLDRRILIVVSLSGIALSLAATAGAWRFWQVGAVVCLWAASLSLFWPTFHAWLGDSHRPTQLGRATGATNLSWSVGGMLGGLAAGWFYTHNQMLPFLLGIVPAVAACTAMVISPCPHRRPKPAQRTRMQRGAKRLLAAAWLGSMSACCLVGVIVGVFPKLGQQIGVNSFVFGVLVFGIGLGRTCMFALGFRWSRCLQDWRTGTLGQLVAAAMVATVAGASAHWWLMLVFVSVGLGMGINFYRGLYVSLEGEGPRGVKSGLHEAALVSGLLAGSLGGGVLAKVWGLRAPYIPVAALVIILVALQAGLISSAATARRKAKGQDRL